MVRYLKYIVIVFGSIGLLVGSFFYYQNRVDIQKAWEYEDQFELEYLKTHCPEDQHKYLYPCLKEIFQNYLREVSLTGTNMGLKMVFSGMDEIKAHQTLYTDQKVAQLRFALDYIEINNLALENAYQRYFGIQNMYGGFIASLGKYYPKAYEFSENMILGLKSSEGLESLVDENLRALFTQELEHREAEFYRIKQDVEIFIENETKKLESKT